MEAARDGLGYEAVEQHGYEMLVPRDVLRTCRGWWRESSSRRCSRTATA